jgi:two-component system, response regulator RegA
MLWREMGQITEDGPKSCLVVEDDERLCAVIAEALASLGFVVRVVGSVKAARAALMEGPPDLLVLDVVLPDGRAVELLDVLQDLSPAPCVVAISGAAGPEEGFELAARGVRAYLKKPLNLEELQNGVTRALSEPPNLAPHVKSVVGRAPVHEVEQLVRDTMVQEALARGKGNRRQASRVLGISRQLLQHILRKG